MIPTRPQLALQSYLDGLLQEATQELLWVEPEPIAPLPVAEPVELDDFAAAVLEEQVRDAVVVPAVVVPLRAPDVVPAEAASVADTPDAVAQPLVQVHLPATPGGQAPVYSDGRPAWAAEPFECLLFDVAGLTLAVPLVCLGSIYSLAGRELTPLFGQPDWFLGILPSQSGNLKVLDTARWVMPDRYRDDFREGLQYVISVQGYEWGLAVHQVSRSLRLDPSEIKWRTQRGQRPWLAGTVIEHMCALLDVAELAELIASGAVKHMSKAASVPQT